MTPSFLPGVRAVTLPPDMAVSQRIQCGHLEPGVSVARLPPIVRASRASPGWSGTGTIVEAYVSGPELPWEISHSPLVNFASVLYYPQQENDLEVCHVGSKSKA